MIDRSSFYQRLDFCKKCEFWKGRCLKGHALQSAAGCPVRKFPPVAGAGYAPDRPVPIEPDMDSLGGCCGN